MGMYSFSLESLTTVACRSVGGLDDVWAIATVHVGTRMADVTARTIGLEVQAGQGFTGPWSAGPYQTAAGETGVVTCTVVNMHGSGVEDQQTVVSGLAGKILAAVTSAERGAGGATPGTIAAAVRGVFGAMGELVGAPAIATGEVDCRGLLGVYAAPFTVAAAGAADDVETTGAVPLTAPAAAGGTAPQSTGVFSVRRGGNLFSQSTPLAVLPSGAGTEIFAVGMDGLVRYNARPANGTFGTWQAAWPTRTFSQSAPLVAVAGVSQRKDVFGTGTDGVIYRMSASLGGGWGDWTAVSTVGQFLPDTPVSAISLSGVLSVFAVDPDGVAQSMTWNGDAVLFPWAPLPGMVFARRTSLLVISHIDTWVEVFGVDPLGHDYHTSRANNQPAWGPWQMIGGAPFAVEPSSRKYLGLTFSVFSAPNVSTELGMAWLRVDGGGSVNELGWTNATGWIGRNILAGVKTIFAGSVSGVRLGNQLLLYMVDARTAQIGVTSWPMPFPSGPNPGWSAWTLLPPGPSLAKERAITAISTDDSHVELFVVDREGVVQHVTEDTGPGWGTWSVV